MNRIVAAIVICACGSSTAFGQVEKSSLQRFFELRSQATPRSPVPSYEELLRVTDTIRPSSPEALAQALPLIFSCLSKQDNEIAVQALFAVSVIAQRPDGGALLRSRLREIVRLLDLEDERLVGGAALLLRSMLRTESSLLSPLLREHLKGSKRLTLPTLELLSGLLNERPGNPELLKLLAEALASDMDPRTRIAALQTFSRKPIPSGSFPQFVLGALGHDNKHVKIAAIYAAHALGPASEIWPRAVSIWKAMLVNPNEDPEIKELAAKALKNTLIAALRSIVFPSLRTAQTEES